MARPGEAPIARASIEPFVALVERGHRQIDDATQANGAMPAAGFDVNRRHRLHRHHFTVQLEVSFPFEDEVNLGHPLVVVRTRVGLNVHEMDAGGVVVCAGKRAPSPAAWTARSLHSVELGDKKIRHDTRASSDFLQAGEFTPVPGAPAMMRRVAPGVGASRYLCSSWAKLSR